MRKSSLRLYAPFLAIALVQALFIAVAPSKPAGRQEVAAGGFTAGNGAANVGGGDAAVGFDGAGTPIDANGVPVVSGGGTSGGTGTGSGTSGGSSGTGGASGGGGGGSGGGGPVAGDTSHCTPDGKQFGILIDGGPPCIAKWPAGADNGGATYQGVTKDSIKIVYFSSIPNEQVDAILATQGLAVSAEDEKAFYDAAFKFVSQHYEFYGRKLDIKFIEGDCPTTPPDYDRCLAAAQAVVKEKPFMVVWGTPLYASVFDVWAQNGIVAIGGWHFDVKYFNDRRPYRYDAFMDGTQSADFIAEFYCKNMVGRPADHAGTVIQPTIGGRTTKRHLGIVVPEIDANVSTANRVRDKVAECSGGKDVPEIKTYVSDIEQATQQTQATVQFMIQKKVTTITCMCDPIAPAFLTTGMTQNGYFPEFLMPGLGLLDYDLVGRLYNPQQMAHAFGPSHLAVPINLDQSDPARVWQAEGNAGHPCSQNGCGLEWAYTAMVATALQMAGPNLNPLTVEHGMLSLPPRGGGANPITTLVRFGPNDYTALSDIKIVYWVNGGTSPVDNQPKGAYTALDKGKRYQLGQLPSDSLSKIPVAAS